MANTMAKLRPADQLLTSAVAETLTALEYDDIDKAAVSLAGHYAAAIDAQICGECSEHRSLDVLGPKLLAALEALGATPAARSKLAKGGSASAGPNRIAAIREARR